MCLKSILLPIFYLSMQYLEFIQFTLKTVNTYCWDIIHLQFLYSIRKSGVNFIQTLIELQGFDIWDTIKLDTIVMFWTDGWGNSLFLDFIEFLFNTSGI